MAHSIDNPATIMHKSTSSTGRCLTLNVKIVLESVASALSRQET